MDSKDDKYREILISPLRQCATYTPKFGHKNDEGVTLSEFQVLYGEDAFYKWLGLDNPLIYSAHKAAGGITSIYRQIGIGCERLVREIFIDSLNLSTTDVIWSYTIPGQNEKTRKLSLDGRIDIANITNENKRLVFQKWVQTLAQKLGLESEVASAMKGVVFEVRQGYKSKDSKRQNADIANAAIAYTKGYIPCLMVMSAQIDDDIVARYKEAKWIILTGSREGSTTASTFSFFKDIVGFDLADFMSENQSYFQSEVKCVLTALLNAE